MKLTFVKCCRVCQKEFYAKEVSSDQFGNLMDNSFVRFEYPEVNGKKEGKAILPSVCGECIPVVEMT